MSPGFCQHCGSPLKAGARFCGNCGKSVEAAPSPGAGSASVQPTPQQPQYASRAAPIEERNIVVYALLTFITCGLWSLVWWFQMGSDLQRATGTDKPNVGIDFLLTIVTCGLWGIVITIQWPAHISMARSARGLSPAGDLVVVSILLALFTGFGHYIYWQMHLNQIARGHN